MRHDTMCHDTLRRDEKGQDDARQATRRHDDAMIQLWVSDIFGFDMTTLPFAEEEEEEEEAGTEEAAALTPRAAT